MRERERERKKERKKENMTSESSPTPTPPPLSASAPASPPPPPAAAAAAAIRPVFEPVDTLLSASTAAGGHDDVESPSLTNGRALARFEFEPGRSKDGTKVLMVEWEEDDATKSVVGDWEISWEGKKTVLPARDQPQTTPTSLSSAATAAAGDQEQPVNRLYFLLGPGVTIPTAVKLQKAHITWRTSPLPAIFPPELGATARQAGKKGVLHTIWAKKRLQVLQQEIQAESKENVEGIGLEMAAAEKQWIEQNFGVQARPGGLSVSTHPSAMSSVYSSSGSSTTTGNLHSPASPRSPGGGRLMDKLKGLKLGTSPSELASPRTTTTTSDAAPLPENYHNPLSPESSDVAVGSFGSFAELKGVPPTTTNNNNNTLAAQAPQQQQPRKMMPQRPPESFAAQQRQQAGGGVGGMGSLNAFTSGDLGMSQSGGVSEDHHDEDDLFALPMSPRSPEMTKSPFSFAVQDTMKYLKEERAL